jgi:hypothetical protein
MAKLTNLFSTFWRKDSKASKEAKGKEAAKVKETVKGKETAKGKGKAKAEDSPAEAAPAEETDRPGGAGVLVGRNSLSSAPSRYSESSHRAPRKASISTDHSEPRRGHRADRYVYSYNLD